MQRVLLVDGNRGIYIPKQFADNYGEQLIGAAFADPIAICKQGPDHADYWQAWDEIERDGIVVLDGKQYTLHQDGDLWAIPEGYEWPED